MKNPIISVKDLTKHYSDVKAVDGVSFDVEEGEVFAFLGPNGAGKSTTIKMLTTLTTPTAGSIRLNGCDALKDRMKVRKSFGIVFQDQSLDDELTAYENMSFHAAIYSVPKDVRSERIKQLLEMVELWNRKDSYVKTFSGGMKRRLEIARGMIHHPRVLFLDEPTLGLDPQTRNRIWEHIKELNQEETMTVFFTTHYMNEAEEVADHAAIIDHGKIIADGKVADIKESTGAQDLEEAFLALTGRSIRDENATSADRMRLRKKVMRR